MVGLKCPGRYLLANFSRTWSLNQAPHFCLSINIHNFEIFRKHASIFSISAIGFDFGKKQNLMTIIAAIS